MVGRQADPCKMGVLQAWKSPFASFMGLGVLGWETRLQSFPIQVPLALWIGGLSYAGLQFWEPSL